MKYAAIILVILVVAISFTTAVSNANFTASGNNPSNTLSSSGE